MSGRASSPTKGRATAQYPTLAPPGGFQEDDGDTGHGDAATIPSMAANTQNPDLRTQIMALQQAQIKQACETANNKAMMDNIQNLLERLLTREDAQISVPLNEPDVPLPSIEQGGVKGKRTAKAPDPDKLTDGIKPSFDNWRIQVRGKLRINADHFANEDARMYYVYSCTSDDAQKHLYPRHNPDTSDPFDTAEEMIKYLGKIYTDPYRVENARYDYERLQMKFGQSFHDFKTQFLHLADEAQIPHLERFNHMYDRVTFTLRNHLMSLKYAINGDFEKLCQIATGSVPQDSHYLWVIPG
jgi:hypothetical protein